MGLQPALSGASQSSEPKRNRKKSMSERNRTFILIVSCGVFLTFGALMSLLGPILPILSERLGESLTVLGSIFTATFAGMLISQLIVGSLGDKYGMGSILLGGAALLAVGFLGISWSTSLWLTLVMGWIAGLGVGAIDLGANLLVAMLFKAQSVSKVNLLNMFYGIGGFIGPAAVSLSMALFSSAMIPIWGLGAFLILLLPVLYWIAVACRFRAEAEPAGSKDPKELGFRQIGNFALLWVLGFLLMIYVGMEIGLGGWVTAYVLQTTTLTIETAAIVASIFFISLTAGRVAGIAVGSKLTPVRFLAICFTGAIVGSVLLVAGSGNFTITVLAVIIEGFCYGPVYPTVFAIIAASFSRAPGKAGGLAAALGSAGGTIIPWLQGILLTQVSPLASMICTLVCVLLTAGLLVAAGILIRRQEQPHPGILPLA
jgi:fucose permease